MPAADLPLIDGRRAFGADAANYDRARPQYPARVFELLRARCGLAPGARVFEIGPGTGLATRPLLTAGARVTAIEPDERLAARLRENAPADSLEIIIAPFEDVELPKGGFDLGASATAFHWLDQRPALVKVASLLRPGGWWAMWWNVFGDPDRHDPFHEATKDLLSGLAASPSQSQNWQHPFGLDAETRLADIESVGVFDDAAFENLKWTLVLDPGQVRALYATYSQFSVVEETERNRLLDRLEEIAATDFAGRVARNMCTSIYTARRRTAVASTA